MELYVFILVVLLVAAIADLYVGVANDAVNFLNSALGSKVAPRHVVLLIASLGIFVGTTFSSGMMEVARKGIFRPEFFTMHEVMVIFLAVMITDIILLDFYNTFGLPTSTTVSLVFEILGGAVGVGLYKQLQAAGSLQNVLNYIDATNVLTIVSSIGLSIVFAFVFGFIAQFLTRLVFTFEYSKQLKRYGALYSGVALIVITYFILVKGSKGSSIISADQAKYLSENMAFVLTIAFVAWVSVFQLITVFTNFNVLRIVVLMGTFALALAFAANDLVNFIGAPMAALGAFLLALPSQDPGMLMSGLREPVKANTWILLLAGSIMVITLWISRKARSVTKTEIALGRQEEGVERFESSPLARALVRVFIAFGDQVRAITPAPVRVWVGSRIDPAQYRAAMAKNPDAPAFDLPRASVNLIVSAGLISLGTSLKLPLSTTFVTFMVAMATSLADKSWGRDSAVYRVNGVITVVAGWFFTAFVAFTAAFLLASIVSHATRNEYAEIITIVALVAIAGFAFVQTTIVHSKRESDFAKQESRAARAMDLEDSEKHLLEMGAYVRDISRTIESTYSGLIRGHRKTLRKSRDAAMELSKETDRLAADIFHLMKSYPGVATDQSPRYARMISSLQIVNANLISLTTNSHAHVDNNHTLPDGEQAKDLTEVSVHVRKILEAAIKAFTERDFSDHEKLQAQVATLKEMIHRLDKNQMKRIKSGKSGSRQSLLFIGTMSKAERIADQVVNLVGLYHSKSKKPV